MNHPSTRALAVRRLRIQAAVGAALSALASASLAQSAEPSAGPGLADAPSPYYIGVNQAITHDSNVYRVPFGASDTYTSTSLLAGFDQPISRQRVFGTASVTYNRYFDESTLNNTSYALLAGVDWATIMRLSGNVTTTLDQRLVAPAATADNAGDQSGRNLERRRGISGLARWGGDAALSLEGRLGYSALDYSGPGYGGFDSNNVSASLGVFYRPGPLLRLGVALRGDRTRSENAYTLADGSTAGSDVRGRNIDFLVDYTNGNALTASGRLSYTRQTNETVDGADFSGLTGSINLGYRATAKLAFSLAASRDAGFNAVNGGYAPVAVTGQAGTGTGAVSTGRPLYENNQVTNAVSAGVSYAATAKINVNAGARYSRAKIITSTFDGAGGTANDDVIDSVRGASLGATYAYSRAWTFACALSQERRRVSGLASYGYTADIATCSAQFLWR